MNVDTTITGMDNLLKKMAQMGMAVEEESASALYTEAELLMTDSKKQVPVDTGTLRDSGFVDAPVTTATGASVSLGYGGAATKINPVSKEPSDQYAIYVHEDMEAVHPVGKAHFLSDPFNERLPVMKNNIAQRFKKRLEGM